MPACPFCSLDPSRKWLGNENAIAFADAYPITDGHTLVVPRRHVSSIYELTGEQQSAVWDLVSEVRQRLMTDLKPDGFNIGINEGIDAGQRSNMLMFMSLRPSDCLAHIKLIHPSSHLINNYEDTLKNPVNNQPSSRVGESAMDYRVKKLEKALTSTVQTEMSNDGSNNRRHCNGASDLH
jgi:hypothetical protein